ncbi:alpha-L-rhamnosidase-related protein [Granulicella arctica]|uniref:alpha-L-rhamnosidase-related protein n=1 Tax=Granulicella arctica TaxID=940613 RepID=UPI0021DFDDF5|nr:hypothetical protein [Granulicella arctica]
MACLNHLCRTLLLLIISSAPALAAVPKAQWIAPPSDVPCPVNTFTYLRRVVHLADLKGDLTMHMAADSNAHLWINGHIVRRKVTRFFEPTIATETIDPRLWLHVGDNTLVLLHHSWGPIVTFQRDGCLHAGVYIASSWVVSDQKWRVHRAEEFAPNPKQIIGLPADKGAHRIRFAQFVQGASMPGLSLFTALYDDSKWSQAIEVEDGPWPAQPLPTGTPGQREQQVKPVLLLAQGRSIEHHIAENEPVKIEKSILNAVMKPLGQQAIATPQTITVSGNAGETRYLTLDFGRPVHGYPFFTGSATHATPVIDFAYGELSVSPLTGEPLVRTSGWLNPEAIVGEGYMDRYTSIAGVQHVELPDERTARWWTLHLFFPTKGTFQITDLGFVSSQYPVDIKGSFRASDPRIAQIVQLSLEHAIVSMSDTYVDTPGREDGQWLEDARLRAELAAQWFGDTKLRQLFLRLVAESQRPDGTFHPFPPSNYPIVSNADWVAEWVGALYDDYLWTGETTRINAYWPQVEAYWQHVLASVTPTGLWVEDKVFADIRIGVHPTAGQSSGIVTAQLIDRLALSIKMANAAGRTEKAAEWQAIHDRMTSAFQRDHLIGSSAGLPLHVDDVAEPGNLKATRGYSQAAQVMAIDANLLQPSDAKADLEYAFTDPLGSPPAGVDRWNNPTYVFRSLDALSSVGLSDRAVRHLLDRFSPYLPGDPNNLSPKVLQGAFGGPLPEYWISRKDLGLPPGTPVPTQPIDATGSHGWNAVALVWLHKRLLGVSIEVPGGSELMIQPDAAGLTHIEGTTMTPKGPVTIAWTPAMPLLTITLPEQVRAHILLPQALAAIAREGHLRAPSSCKREGDASYICTGSKLVFAAKFMKAEHQAM